MRYDNFVECLENCIAEMKCVSMILHMVNMIKRCFDYEIANLKHISVWKTFSKAFDVYCSD